MPGHKLPSSIGTAGKPKPKPRRKAVDQPSHSALAKLLASTIAYANIGHWPAANQAAHNLVRVLKAHGIDPT
jgi:hypothetical protein